MKFETVRIHFLSDVCFGLLLSRNFATMATWRDFSLLHYPLKRDLRSCDLCLTFVFILYVFRPTTPEGVESVLSENDDQYEEETRRVVSATATFWNQISSLCSSGFRSLL